MNYFEYQARKGQPDPQPTAIPTQCPMCRSSGFPPRPPRGPNLPQRCSFCTGEEGGIEPEVEDLSDLSATTQFEWNKAGCDR
jgi:hypothetical protein